MTDFNYPRIAGRVFLQPLLITPHAADLVVSALAPRLGLTYSPQLAHDGDGAREARPYRVAQGVAVVPVIGELVQRGANPDARSALTGYSNVTSLVAEAMDDTEVRGIVLDVDSPGGEAAGAFDGAAELAQLRGPKPIVASVNELAASGAYLMASAADRVVVHRNGHVGSVGVVTVHENMEKRAERLGVEITHIYAGSHKIDGHPFAPLPDDVRADIQARVDTVYGEFVSTVAASRGISEQAVRDTEARVYRGADGVSAGLADAVGTFQQVFQSVAAPSVTYSIPTGGSTTMNATTVVKETLFTQDQLNEALTEQREALQTEFAVALEQQTARLTGEHTAALEASQTQAQERISAILASDEAKGREAQAQHFAFKTSMSPDDAKAALAVAPLAAALTPAAAPGLAGRMAGENTPQIPPDAAAPVAGGGGPSSPQTVANDIVSDFVKATGTKLEHTEH